MRNETKIELVTWIVAAMLTIPFVVGLMSILLFLLGGAHG